MQVANTLDAQHTCQAQLTRSVNAKTSELRSSR